MNLLYKTETDPADFENKLSKGGMGEERIH